MDLSFAVMFYLLPRCTFWNFRLHEMYAFSAALVNNNAQDTSIVLVRSSFTFSGAIPTVAAVYYRRVFCMLRGKNGRPKPPPQCGASIPCDYANIPMMVRALWFLPKP